MKSSQTAARKWLSLAAGAALLLALYFLLLRRPLGSALASWIELALIAGLALATVLALIAALYSLGRLLFSQPRRPRWQKLAGQLIFLLAALALLAAIVLGSQAAAYTPPILGADGNPLPNSIAALEKVRLGGVDQWLILRGQDVNKPVLLFLSGGPGASEAGRVLRFNQELEKHFVVVIWEQRGCGKSYPSINPTSDLTLGRYVADAIELSEMLRRRFDEQKIYLVGHSWGTIIGVAAAQARPELFHAYVGTAQMVNVRSTDQIIYQAVLEHAQQTGDDSFVRTLQEQGPPPYSGENPIQPYATLFGREYAVFEVPGIRNEEYRRDGDAILLMLKQPEYGWLDRVYYLLGLMNTFNIVYPQLQTFDFRLDAARLELPVYFVLGRHDMNAPTMLSQAYFDLLIAPAKRLDYFEESGHGMIWQEADRFHRLMVETVLPETYP